jgi:hypothetical protein
LPLDRIARHVGKIPAPKAVGPDGKEIPLESPAALEAFARPLGP